MRWSLLGCETMVPSLKIGPIPKKEIHLLSLFRGKLLLSSMDWERGVRVGQAVVSAVGEILHRCRAGFRFQASQIHPPYPRNRKPFWIHGWLVRSLVQYSNSTGQGVLYFFRQSFFLGEISRKLTVWVGEIVDVFFPALFFWHPLIKTALISKSVHHRKFKSHVSEMASCCRGLSITCSCSSKRKMLEKYTPLSIASEK